IYRPTADKSGPRMAAGVIATFEAPARSNVPNCGLRTPIRDVRVVTAAEPRIPPQTRRTLAADTGQHTAPSLADKQRRHHGARGRTQTSSARANPVLRDRAPFVTTPAPNKRGDRMADSVYRVTQVIGSS